MINKFGYHTYTKHTLVYEHRKREDWKEIYEVSIQQKVSKTNSSPDVNSSFDFIPGDMAYLVTVVYSSSDSYGKAEKGSVEDIWLFKNPRIAMDFKRHILSVESKREWNDRPPHKDYHYSNEEEDFNYKPTSVPWNHWNEHFEECLVTMVLVEPNYNEI